MSNSKPTDPQAYAKCDNGSHEGCIHRRTVTVAFTIQLWPPPPLDARPYWCYLDTLIFYDKQNREVWRQRVPLPFKGGRNRRDVSCRRVEKQETFGWVLRYEATHKAAEGILWLIGQQNPPNMEDD